MRLMWGEMVLAGRTGYERPVPTPHQVPVIRYLLFDTMQVILMNHGSV